MGEAGRARTSELPDAVHDGAWREGKSFLTVMSWFCIFWILYITGWGFYWISEIQTRSFGYAGALLYGMMISVMMMAVCRAVGIWQRWRMIVASLGAASLAFYAFCCWESYHILRDSGEDIADSVVFAPASVRKAHRFHMENLKDVMEHRGNVAVLRDPVSGKFHKERRNPRIKFMEKATESDVQFKDRISFYWLLTVLGAGIGMWVMTRISFLCPKCLSWAVHEKSSGMLKLPEGESVSGFSEKLRRGGEAELLASLHEFPAAGGETRICWSLKYCPTCRRGILRVSASSGKEKDKSADRMVLIHRRRTLKPDDIGKLLNSAKGA